MFLYTYSRLDISQRMFLMCVFCFTDSTFDDCLHRSMVHANPSCIRNGSLTTVPGCANSNLLSCAMDPSTQMRS